MQHQLPDPAKVTTFFHANIEEIELPFFSRVVNQGNKHLCRPAAFLPQVVPDDGNTGLVTFLEQLAVDAAPGEPLLWCETPDPLAQNLIDARRNFVRHRPWPGDAWLTGWLGRLRYFDTVLRLTSNSRATERILRRSTSTLWRITKTLSIRSIPFLRYLLVFPVDYRTSRSGSISERRMAQFLGGASIRFIVFVNVSLSHVNLF
jgi:hypothetical protein